MLFLPFLLAQGNCSIHGFPWTITKGETLVSIIEGTSAQVCDFVAMTRPQMISGFESVIFPERRVAAGLFRLCEAVFRLHRDTTPFAGPAGCGVGTDLPARIYQREGGTQPLVVFPDASIAHLGESKDTLQDAKRMLHLGSHAGLGRVLAPGCFIHTVLVSGPAASHILRFRCGCADVCSSRSPLLSHPRLSKNRTSTESPV